jgi:hypothetical protein
MKQKPNFRISILRLRYGPISLAGFEMACVDLFCLHGMALEKFRREGGPAVRFLGLVAVLLH